MAFPREDMLLDKMKVELIDYMGDDLSIVNAARVSYAKSSKWETEDDGLRLKKTLRPADVGLIGYLMKNRHGTPFEMVQFQFRLHLPIRVMWDWIRHRIASYNGMSSRYVEMETVAYMPPIEAIRGRVGKPGHYQMVSLDPLRANAGLAVMEECYDYAFKSYKALLELGWAPELAAYVLPFGTYTEFIWSINLRSLFNFLSLRTHETALLELRTMAITVEGLVHDVVPNAMWAFEENGRVAP